MTTSRGSRTTAALATLGVVVTLLVVGPAHADDDPAPSSGDPAPTDTVPTDPVPTDPAPTDPAPTDPAPTDPAPTDPAPTDPAPTDPAPTDPAPTDPAPTDPTPVATTVTAEAAPTVFGRTATVAVKVAGSDDVVPTGTVTVLDGSTELDQVTLDEDASVDAEVDTTSLRSGAHELTVRYDGSDEAESSETSTTLDVSRAPTTTSVAVEGTPRRGHAATLVATVTSQTGSTPVGDLVVRRGDAVLASGSAVHSATEPGASARLQIPTAGLPIGTTTLTVAFESDADADDSLPSSATLSLDLGQGELQLAASGPTTVSYGTSATIAVTVADPTSEVPADGLVMVSDGASVVGIGVISQGKGWVRVARTALTPGVHQLTVAFNGNAETEASQTTLPVTVTRAVPTVTASISPGTVRRRAPGAVATVSVSAPGGVVDGGKVAVRRGSRVIARGEVKAGVASIALPVFVRTGVRTLTVRYGGTTLVGPGSTTATITVTAR